MDAWRMTLFLGGRSVRALRAQRALEELFAGWSEDDVELEIIDVLAEPHLAEEHSIIATPALIRRWPPPTLRVVGDLTDVDELALLLEVPRNREAS